MRRRFSLLILMILVLAAPGACLAETPGEAPLLVPDGDLDAVRGRMLVVESALTCDRAGCSWAVEQRWAIENTDKTQDRSLVLVLQGADAAVDPVLNDEQGNALTPQQRDRGLQWVLVIRAGQRANLKLTYRTRATDDHIVLWSLSGEALSAWNSLDGVRIRTTSPETFREDRLAVVEPSSYSLVGSSLTWDYENASSYADHSIAMLSPWSQHLAATYESQGAHLDRAALVKDVASSAKDVGVPWPNPHAEIEAALQSAIADAPGDPEALWALADYYLARQTDDPDRAHNYLVLAAGALSDLVSAAPNDARAKQLLSELYMQASRQASQSGDLGGALEYIQLAEAAGARTATTQEDHQLLALRWGVALAKQGQPTEALAKVGDSLSPAAQEDIAHYAPPFAAAETRVTYGLSSTTCQTAIQYYAPLADETLAEVQRLAETISTLEGWSAVVAPEPSSCTIAVSLALSDGEDASASRDALLKAIHNDADMLANLIALPWRGNSPLYEISETPWARRLAFEHAFDSRPLAAMYDDQADYAGWRLAEIRARQPETTVAQLEQELVMAALEEQVTIWRQLPASCYWVAQLDGRMPVGSTQLPTWVVGWGQLKPLNCYASEYRWPAIGATVLAAMAFASLLGVAAFWGRRSSGDESGR